MEYPVTPVVIGGLISGVSVLAGVVLKHWLDILKLGTEIKQHPSYVIYDKQIEFFDKLVPIIEDLNGYITTIDVWLGETSKDAKERVQEAMENSLCVTKFGDLIQKYYMYLPEKLLKEANDMHFQCMLLGNSATQDKTFDCINRLFRFQNTIRECVGIDKLSEDLLKAFGSLAKERKQADEID